MAQGIPVWVQVVMPILCITVPALVSWVWALWKEMQSLKIKMIEEYAKLSMIREIRDDMSHMRNDMSRILDRLEIPTVHRG